MVYSFFIEENGLYSVEARNDTMGFGTRVLFDNTDKALIALRTQIELWMRGDAELCSPHFFVCDYHYKRDFRCWRPYVHPPQVKYFY